ncbi:putative myb-like protein X-like 2, partial [Homarus americanus]
RQAKPPAKLGEFVREDTKEKDAEESVHEDTKEKDTKESVHEDTKEKGTEGIVREDTSIKEIVREDTMKMGTKEIVREDTMEMGTKEIVREDTMEMGTKEIVREDTSTKEKGSLKKEKQESPQSEQTKKPANAATSVTRESSGIRKREAKVVLKRLANYYTTSKTGKQSKSSSEAKVAVKRLTNSKVSRRKGDIAKKMTTLPRKKFGLALSSLMKDAGASRSPPKGTKRVAKRKMESDSSSNDNKTFGRHKKIKRKRGRKFETQNTATDTGKNSMETVVQVNKDIMNKLLNFGAEVAEAMAVNNEAIFGLSAGGSTIQNPLQTLKGDGDDDFDDEEVSKIIRWLEEEEEQRRTYRKRILESLRASHNTNMTLYTQMLQVLQSVTSSA